MVKDGVRGSEVAGDGQFRMELAVMVSLEKPGRESACLRGDCRTGAATSRRGVNEEDCFLGVVCFIGRCLCGVKLGEVLLKSSFSGLYSFLGLLRRL